MKNKKRHIKLMVLALLLSACSGEDSLQRDSSRQVITIAADVAGAETRAGASGCIDYDVFTTEGFGVFAASDATGFSSDWLSNEHMTYTPAGTEALEPVHLHPTNWSYGPQKLWPADQSISFFGYGPYVAAGDAGPGITAVNGTTADDPYVSYRVATDVSQAVDLLWGVRGATGLPWTHATAATTGGLVTLTFHHAMAAVGFHAQVMVDQDNNLSNPDDHTTTGLPGSASCKVTLKSITLSATGGGSFFERGNLHLNNATAKGGTAYQPRWSNTSGTLNDFVLSGTALSATLRDPNPANAADVGTFMNNDAVTGINETANTQRVISDNANGKEQCWMFIPKSAQDYCVKVEYYVTYKTGADSYQRLDYTGANAVVLNISDWQLKADTKYYLNLVFGLKTLDVTLDATDWAGTPVPVTVSIEHGTSAGESLAREIVR